MLKIRLWLVMGALVTAAVIGVFGGMAWLTNQPEPPPEPPPVPEAVGFAGEVATAWVLGRPLSVPVAANVSPVISQGVRDGKPLAGVGPVIWDSFELLQPQPERFIEVHRFILSGSPPRMLEVTVELTNSGPVLAAAPAMAPLALSGEAVTRLDYTDVEGAPRLTDDVRDVADKWAQAFAGDDRDRLRELTGDVEQRVYAGLGGFTVSDTKVVSAVPSPQVPGSWVVRVESRLEDEAGFAGAVEWDLLVSGPETANPRVTAWGAPGRGLYLTAFENGVAGDTAATPTTRPGVPGTGVTTTTTG